MEREPLDSAEYESIYLELRPDYERLSDTTDAALPTRRRGDGPVHDTVAPHGIAPADTGVVRVGPRTIPAPPFTSAHDSRPCVSAPSPRRAARRFAAPQYAPTRFRRCDQSNCLLETKLALGRCWGPACWWWLARPSASSPTLTCAQPAACSWRSRGSCSWARLARDAASGTIRRRRSPSAGSLGDRSRDVLRDRALGGVRASGFCCVLKDGGDRDGWGWAHHWPSRSGSPHVM